MIKNLKIIEISSVLAGPSVGMFFAELGAEVIKIENKLSNGDITRKWHQTMEDSDKQSAYFSSVNWGKKHVFLDFNDSSDKKKLIQLLKVADVLITNFKHGDAEKFNLTYKLCKSINDKIIYAKIEGFKSNPKRVAFDAIIQAETGFMSINGESGKQGFKMPVAMMDILAAHQLKEGILVGLLHRSKTGRGSYISSSLYNSAIASLANQATNWLMADHIPTRLGSTHPNIAPYGEIVTTKDNQKLVLAIGTNKQFVELCKIIGRIDLPKKDNFSTNEKRVLNREKLLVEIIISLQKIDSQFFIENCIKNDVPCGFVKNLKQVFETPEAVKTTLNETIKNQPTSRVKTVAFEIRECL